MSIKVEGLSKSYTIAGKQIRIIDELDLEVKSGEMVSITGKSGCGKSTLFNLINGIAKPDSGTVYLNKRRNRYWYDVDSSRLRNREIGSIFQTFELLNNETVISNILLPARIKGIVNSKTMDMVDKVLSDLNISEYKNTVVQNLSGGQQQRVAIARALINNPSIILADEPTANLDKDTSLEIFKILDDLRLSGKAVVIITHKDYMHKNSNRVYSMVDGKLRLIK